MQVLHKRVRLAIAAVIVPGKISVADLRESDLGRVLESLAATASFVCILAALAGAWIATPAGFGA